MQGQHELARQPLPQRMRLDVGGQFFDEIIVAAQGQFKIGQAFDSGQPPLVQPCPGTGDVVGVHVREWLSPPQRQRGACLARGGLWITGGRLRLGSSDLAGELLKIELPGLGEDHVSGRLSREHLWRPRGAQHLADRRYRGVYLRAGRIRRCQAPHRADEPVGAQHGPGVQEQVGEHRAMPRRHPRQPPARGRHLHRTQDRESHTQFRPQG